MKLIVQKNGLINPNCIRWLIFLSSIIWLLITVILLYVLQTMSTQFYTAIPISQITRYDVDEQNQQVTLSVVLPVEYSNNNNNPILIYGCQVQDFVTCRDQLQSRMQASSPLFAYKIIHNVPLLSQYKHIHYGEYLIDEDWKKAVEETNAIFYIASLFQIGVLLAYIVLLLFYVSYYCIFYNGIVSSCRYFLPLKTVVVVPSNSACLPYLPTNMVYPFEKFFDHTEEVEEVSSEATTETSTQVVLDNRDQVQVPFVVMRMVSTFLKSEESGNSKVETILQWKRAYKSGWTIGFALLWVGMTLLYSALFITAFVLTFFQHWIPLFAGLSVLSTIFVLIIHTAVSNLLALLDRSCCHVLITSQRICKVYHHWWCRSVVIETLLWNEVKQVQSKQWQMESTVVVKSDESEIAPLFKKFSLFHSMKVPKAIAEEIIPLLQSNKSTKEMEQK